MKQNRSLRQALPDYIPEAAVSPIADWFDINGAILIISRDRRTKLGDCRSYPNGKPTIISVNYNLNKFSFLVTLLHEMAHAMVYKKYTKRVTPHGREWKLTFREIARNFLISDVFPSDVLTVFSKYLANPTASSTSNVSLSSVLRNYDDNPSGVTVSMLSPESLFYFGKGKMFRMVGKVRKRYRCYCLNNKKTYLFSPLATITPYAEPKKETDH